MKHAKVVLGCLLIVMLVACKPARTTSVRAVSGTSTLGPASPQALRGTPTIDLRTSSVEFELEIEGDPHVLTAVRGVEVDQQGDLYVVDCGSNRIQKFDDEGNFITTWGSKGTGDGQFALWLAPGEGGYPAGDVASDSQGHVYVADAGNSRIQVFDSEGQYLFKWGELGMGDGQFFTPTGVAVGPDGDVYVTDGVRGDVQRFDSEGQLLARWSVPGMESWEPLTPGVDRKGNVYVPTAQTKDVCKFDSSGTLLARIGEAGTGDGQFQNPLAAAVDSQSNLYVTDGLTHSVQKFDTEGNFLVKWGSMGSGQGEFRSPSGLTVAVDGSVYVADGNNRIQKFRQR